MLVGLRKSDFSPKLISEEANAAMEEREGEREFSRFSLSGELLFSLWFSQSPKQSRAGPYSNLRKKGRDSGDDDDNGDGMQETAARSDLLPFDLDLSALPRRPFPFSDGPLRVQSPCRFADLPSQIYSCDDQEHRRSAESHRICAARYDYRHQIHRAPLLQICAVESHTITPRRLWPKSGEI